MSGGRRIAALLALLLLGVALCGCHGARKSEAFAVPAAFDESVPREITFWAKNDTNKAQTEIYSRAIAEFEALYPSIRVKLRLYTDYGKIYNDVITNIATGTTPDVCITYPDHIATYLTGENVVEPLDPLMEHPAYGLGGSALRFVSPEKEALIDRYREEGAFGGHYYALPFMRSTEACYVNKTYVEALGFSLPEVLTWDFVFEVSDRAAEKGADGNFLVNGQNVLLPFIYKSTDNMMIQYLRQSGAGYADADGTVRLFNDETRAFLCEISRHTARGAFSTFKISGYPANFLNAGQCIFAVDSTAGATWMGPKAPLLDISPDRLVDFEIAVRPVPQVDPEKPQMISQGPSVCVFHKEDPQQVLAAWLFTQYLLTDGVQIDYASTEGYVPVTKTARQNEAYLDYLARSGEDDAHYAVKLQATELLLQNVDHTFVTPVYNGSASLRDAAGALIESVTKATRRKQTVDDAFIDALYADTASLYRLDQIASQRGGGTLQGPLPPTAVWLLSALGAAWVLMGIYVLAARRGKRNK